ncbi:ABC transporter substrate-binding protein [Dactylosporangium sp. CA-152071]|uniref:ABC transporter substrate-binding protein n=1 Tax=Dactylosporangium sp. CA-152071 TaxID=3239933 RepID=UPI003D936A80
MARLARLSAALAAVMAVAACGGTTSDAPGTSGLSGTVEVVAKWSGVEQTNFKKVLEHFQKKTGVKTIYTSAGDDVASFLNQKISGGTPPSIALIPQPGTVADLAKKGSLKPLSGEALDTVTTNYSAAWKDLGTVDGNVYGFYLKAAQKSICWYRTDAFATAGVREPKTWEAFIASARTLADAGITPFAVPGGSAWTLTDFFENVYIQVGGPDNYDKLSRHEIPWTDPTVVRSLDMIGRLWSTPRMIDGGNAGALKIDFSQSVAEVFGEKPKAAILCEGDFVGSEITKAGRYRVGDTARYMPFPSISNARSSVVVGGDQAVALKDDKATMALMAYLASKESAEIFAKGGGFITPNKTVDPSAYPDDTVRGLANLVVSADVIKFDMSDLAPASFGGGTNADEWKLLQEFLGNPAMDVNALAGRLEEAAEKDFGSN